MLLYLKNEENGWIRRQMLHSRKRYQNSEKLDFEKHAVNNNYVVLTTIKYCVNIERERNSVDGLLPAVLYFTFSFSKYFFFFFV
ncbi:hypothetical protein PGB90_005028 [Kerria lacca]